MEVSRRGMDDIDRLFRCLVSQLAAAPERLNKPFQISELYQQLIPYRIYKRELAFDSIEDYEMAVLRLLAGEHDYASIEPADVQAALAEEAQLPNPTPGAFRDYAAATVKLSRDAIRNVLNQDHAYAPPPTEPQIPPASAPPTDEPSDVPPGTPDAPTLVFQPVESLKRCPQCAAELPAERQATFCPWCGHRLEAPSCRRCGELLKPAWRYCLACGQPTRG